MAYSKDFSNGFRLVPFMQNRTNSVSFFLASPYNHRPVMNFFIDIQDYRQPDGLYDMLALAVDSLEPYKPEAGNS